MACGGPCRRVLYMEVDDTSCGLHNRVPYRPRPGLSKRNAMHRPGYKAKARTAQTQRWAHGRTVQSLYLRRRSLSRVIGDRAGREAVGKPLTAKLRGAAVALLQPAPEVNSDRLVHPWSGEGTAPRRGAAALWPATRRAGQKADMVNKRVFLGGDR